MTDTRKFLILTQEFIDIYVNAQEFATKIGSNRDTSINNWVNGVTQNIGYKYKNRIIDTFELPHDFWLKDFNRDDTFRNYLKKIKAKKDGDFDKWIIDQLPTITTKEKEMLNEKLEDYIDLNRIKDTTPTFMFEYAKKLQEQNRIQEALEVLKMIDENGFSYESTYHHQVDKLKAILLSDDKIKDWDGAITILKRLYISAEYHKDEPEIPTLIASNYKRKAFYNSKTENLLPKDKVDVNLLISAIALYKESYRVKDSKDKYYDAINMAYLFNILDAIEMEEEDNIEIKELYDNLSKVWKINEDDWWAVISNAEFLMLLGRVDEANLRVNRFFKLYLDKVSNIEATFRQLDIYIHFTGDENAIKFKKSLQSNLKLEKTK